MSYVASFWIFKEYRSSVWDVFYNFLHKDATDKSKINSDKKRLFLDVNLYPLPFFANTPFKETKTLITNSFLTRKAFKATVANLELPSLHEGSLKITLTVPLIFEGWKGNYNYSNSITNTGLKSLYLSIIFFKFQTCKS